jgi:diguanylate cyclase (GGDEF)-like protein/PAS domain S-box-containing protein
MNLLIVDDNVTNLKLLRAQLEAEGHYIHEAANGVEALEVLEREKSVEGVISDILMPEMDGFQLCLEIRKSKKFSTLPFIFYTSTYNSPQDRQLAKTVGADNYLNKPSPTPVILSALHEAAQRTRPRIAAAAAQQDETYVLKQYNASLVQKLEQRNIELEGAIKNLQIAHDGKQESEQRFRAIFDHAGVGITMRPAHDRKLPWVQVNDHFCQLLGYTRDELLKLSTVDITPADGQARAIRDNQRLQSDDIVGYSHEKQVVRKDGRRIWVLLTVSTMPSPDGHPANMIATYQDISERKEAEEKVSRLNRVYAVLSGINTLIVHVTDRRELFNEACRIAVEQGNFGMAWIGLLDPATQDVTPVAWAGEGAEGVAKAKSSARDDIPQGIGAVGRAIRERRPVFINDITAHGIGGPRLTEILRLGFRSQITLPLFEHQPVVGTLTMYARERDFFDEKEVRLLTELAGNISFALENISKQKKLDKLARLRAVSSEINAAIIRIHERKALLEETCRVVIEHGKFRMIWIGMLDRSSMNVRPAAWAGIDDEFARELCVPVLAEDSGSRGTTPRAVRSKRAAWDNDFAANPEYGHIRRYAIERGVRSAITLPLLIEGEVEGVFALYSEEAGFFTDDEIGALEETASNISLTLEHMARQEKLEKLSRIRAISSEINAAIIRIRERKALLKETCRIVSEQGKFGMIWIGTIDQEKQEVRPVAWMGFSEKTAHAASWASISRSKGVIGEAIQTRKPSVRNDIDVELPVGRLRDEALEKGYRSAVCLPLVVDDKVTALVVLFATGAGFFDKNELALLDEVASDISFALQAMAKQEQLNYLAYYDVLTGLANRSLFLERVAPYIRSAVSGGHQLAVLLIDLQRFKDINDSLGRPAGDALLRQVAQWLTRNAGDANHVARVGADLFAMVVPEVILDIGVAQMLNKTMAAFLEHPFRLNDALLRISLRVGIALYPDDGADADTLLRNAEAALKKAKASGERYLFFTQQMTEKVAGKLSLENQLRQALDNGEFVLHYQPKLNLVSGKLTSAEALIRWNDPRTGLVPPGQFIPILEETGLIHDVGRWALRQALSDYLRWRTAGLPVVRIAVNVSPLQLRNRGFIAEIKEAIGIDAQAPAGIELEITESLIMEDVKHSIASLTAIRALGITIAIDDFGTGFSSLSYLAKLPVDTLKIDRSFVIDMTAGPQGLALVSTIINLGHSLQLKVVAEGVETEEQSNLLRLLKCDEIQGFLFSKPLPAAEFEPMLRAQDTGASAQQPAPTIVVA